MTSRPPVPPDDAPSTPPPPLRWPLRTERLSFRPFEPARDLDAVWDIRRRPEVNNWLTTAYPTRAAFVEARTQVLPPPSLVLVAELDGAVIGDLMVRVEDGWVQKDVPDVGRNCQAELGWTLHPDHYGRGYGTEAARALISLCFGPLGLRRVYAGCFTKNEASWRLMERLGMRRESHNVAESYHRDLGWIDGYVYALLATEWPTG